MTAEEIGALAKEGRLYKFYKSREWLALRREIVDENHGECAWCRERGIISRAETVHHIKHVTSHPELALSRTYVDGDGAEQQNLVPLCHDCHDRAHGRMRYREKEQPLTAERW